MVRVGLALHCHHWDKVCVNVISHMICLTSIGKCWGLRQYCLHVVKFCMLGVSFSLVTCVIISRELSFTRRFTSYQI